MHGSKCDKIFMGKLEHVFEHMHVGQSISQFSFYVKYRVLSSRY